MANYKARYSIQVTDINGDVAECSFEGALGTADTVGAAATLMGTFAADLAAVTNGKVTRETISILVNESNLVVGTTPPNNAEYSSVTDGARLQFANSVGERASITIPAVQEGVFGTSSNVVDSTIPAVATLIAFLAANMKDAATIPLALYKGGIKVGKRARRRRNSLVP